MVDPMEQIEACRAKLEETLNKLLREIGDVQIGLPKQFPFGWRKAAMGRTVWRLLEEVISQNLEQRHAELGFKYLIPASSEVGIYDFAFALADGIEHYVNIKSAVTGGRTNKDDMSKALGLEQFFAVDPSRILLVATIEIEFMPNMFMHLANASVLPLTWIPDIYVNPAPTNGNLKSSQYKSLRTAVRRTGPEFLELLRREIAVAEAKRESKK